MQLIGKVGFITHGEQLSYFSFLPALENWFIKTVCGMINIKDPLLLIRKSSPCSSSSGPLSYALCNITKNQMCRVHH